MPKKFTSEYQPKKNGRKPSHLRKYLKDNNIGTQDVRALLGGILINYKTEEEVKAALLDPKTPPIIKFPLKALLNDYKNGSLNAITFLTRYGYGEPKQEIETKNENYDLQSMSKEERQELKIKLLKKLIAENKELLENEKNNPN